MYSPVAQQCEELGVAHHAVELVAVHHQQALAVRRDVLDFLAQADAGDLQPHRQPGTEHLVVIAGDVGDLGAASGETQDLPQHVVVVLVPVPGLAQPPPVDNVADEIQMLTGGAAQEVSEEVATGATGTKMRIRDKYAAVEWPCAGNDGCVHVRRSRYYRILVDKVKFA